MKQESETDSGAMDNQKTTILLSFVLTGRNDNYLGNFKYRITTYYNRTDQFTCIWNDPKLKIRWPVNNPILSKRDEGANHA